MPELGEFIEEEDTTVAEGDLAGPRVGTTSYEPGIRDRVVRRPERTLIDHRGIVWQVTGH